MNRSVEIQVISKILTSVDPDEVNILCGYDESYYSVYKDQIHFILDHRAKYNQVPDLLTFQSEFSEDISIVPVNESIDYLEHSLIENKQHITFLEMFNKLQDVGINDLPIEDIWTFIGQQYEKAIALGNHDPMDIIHDAEQRAQEILDLSKQARIPSGFKEIDKIIYGGFNTAQELALIVARTNSGKAQPMWSRVLTPSGWKEMKDIQIGDIVIGKSNDNGRVTKIFPQGKIPYYRVYFDDHTYVECADDHLWEVLPAKRRMRDDKHYGEFEVITTKEIREHLDRRYSVDISEPIEFDIPWNYDEELDPYLLGVLLGDGCFSSSIYLYNWDDEVQNKVDAILETIGCMRSRHDYEDVIVNSSRKSTTNANKVLNKIKEYGLINHTAHDKFIPKHYLTAPVDVRKALLAGLVDTDGYKPVGGSTWEFDTSSDQLANDFAELARSLGIWVHVYDRKSSRYKSPKGDVIEGSGSIHIECRSTFNPFTLPRKADRWNPLVKRAKRHCKMIQSIEYIGETECQCLLLDNESHTYITDSYTVTHNSWIVTKMAETAQANGFPTLIYSPEMSASLLGTRFDTFRGHFVNSELQQGHYSDEYKAYIHKLPDEEAPIYIMEDKDVPDGVSVSKIETFVRKHKIKEVIIDGLSYMVDDQKSSRDYEKFEHIALDLFKMSKKLGCVVIASVQANRDTREEKDDKGIPFPSLYSIAGSDSPARIATQVFAVRQIFESHILDIRIEKSRTANHQKAVLSYSWDIGTGTMVYSPSEDSTQLVMPYQDTGQGGFHSIVQTPIDASGELPPPPGIDMPPMPGSNVPDEPISDEVVEF